MSTVQHPLLRSEAEAVRRLPVRYRRNLALVLGSCVFALFCVLVVR